MLLTIMTIVSILFAMGICLEAGSWLWLPLGFVGGFFVCLLLCFLAVWIPAGNVDPQKEQDGDASGLQSPISC